MQNVHVQYGFSDRAEAHLAFAAGLAHRLKATLFVWMRRDKTATSFLQGMTGVDVEAQTESHIMARVRMGVGHSSSGLKPRFAQGEATENLRSSASVLVGEPVMRPYAGAALLSPLGERSYDSRGHGGICLPFGNGDSALEGAEQALGFAARLRLPVLFYHTTWRESGLPETARPEAHMVIGARLVQRTLEKAADAAGVPHRTVIETAATIVEGVCRVALNEGCSMISLTRGRHVGRGSTVDGVTARTTVPVFLTGCRVNPDVTSGHVASPATVRDQRGA